MPAMARSQENLSSWPVAMVSHLSALARAAFWARLANLRKMVPGKISDPGRFDSTPGGNSEEFRGNVAGNFEISGT